MIYFFILFSIVLLNDLENYTNPLLNKKGLKIDGNIKGNLIPSLPQEITPQEIELIKSKAKDYLPEPVNEDDIIIMETNYGIMEFILYNNLAPNHAYNFKKLANSGFYDETIFHRIIPGFMAQGGDILTRDSNKENDGRGNPGWTVDQEFNNIPHKKGILSMARSQDVNSAGSQFFICVDNQPHLDGKYTVFGQLLDLDKSKINAILNHIANALTESKYVYKLSVPALPEGADINKWIKLTNPKNRQPLYIEIPEGEKKASYKREMLSKLRSDNPIVPIEIKSIRVINKIEE